MLMLSCVSVDVTLSLFIVAALMKNDDAFDSY